MKATLDPARGTVAGPAARAAWLLVLALSLPWLAPLPRPEVPVGAVGRWLGPVASLAASFEWVRWNGAVRRGHLERAHAHAARALALDPASPAGWLELGQHLVFDRSAAVMEADPARRVTFARAGLAVLRRGEERSRDPDGLAIVAGDLALFLAERAGFDLPWPGGADALRAEAEASYTRAAARGHAPARARLEALAAPPRSEPSEPSEPSGPSGPSGSTDH